MKPFVLLFFLFTISLYPSELSDFISDHHQLNRTGMLTLGTWGVANIAVGTIGRYSAQGEAKYFHEMNAVWNIINLGIAGFGYYNSMSPDLGLSLGEALKEQRNLESFLLLNSGLDIGYIAFGMYLKERSKNSSNAARLKGYGNSLILQGAFLLIFDLVMYNFQSELSGTFLESIESVEFGLNSIRIRF